MFATRGCPALIRMPDATNGEARQRVMVQKFDEATMPHRFHQRILAVFRAETAV
jgi:hypothetical protein